MIPKCRYPNYFAILACSDTATSTAASVDQYGVKNVMAANSLIYVELLGARHINAVKTRMNSDF
jgi:hypothetical protein